MRVLHKMALYTCLKHFFGKKCDNVKHDTLNYIQEKNEVIWRDSIFFRTNEFSYVNIL